jgi:hypothetical protein
MMLELCAGDGGRMGVIAPITSPLIESVDHFSTLFNLIIFAEFYNMCGMGWRTSSIRTASFLGVYPLHEFAWDAVSLGILPGGSGGTS